MKTNDTMFPSPIGVLYISIKGYWVNIETNGVSVPYWGSLYFNELYAENTKTNKQVFPSPIGVLYISIQNVLNVAAH